MRPGQCHCRLDDGRDLWVNEDRLDAIVSRQKRRRAAHSNAGLTSRVVVMLGGLAVVGAGAIVMLRLISIPGLPTASGLQPAAAPPPPLPNCERLPPHARQTHEDCPSTEGTAPPSSRHDAGALP